MKFFKGDLIAQKILEDLAKKTVKLVSRPELDIICCQKTALTDNYIEMKKKAAKVAKIKIKIHHLIHCTPAKLIQLINQLNADQAINGIIIQLPLPAGFDLTKIIWAIHPHKDVDGFQMREFRPPTPSAIIAILSHYGIGLTGKKVHIVGKGFLVGKPLSLILKKIGCRITISDQSTPRPELANMVSQANIIVSASGQKGVIEPEWLNKKQIVIDAGTSIEEGKLDGDFDSRQISQYVQAITPVPGGVGPVTVAKLMENTYFAAVKQMINGARR